MSRAAETTDVLIVGAGLSGVGAACQLRQECPDKSVIVLEARDAIGGTWDLFRYPGIRSDSDMFTLGYRFSPWTDPKAIADGPSILRYIHDTAQTFGVEKLIRLKHRVVNASWDSDEARWTVEVHRTDTDERFTISCSFLYVCTGYYRYDEGFRPKFPGVEQFRGPVIHPQHWPEDLDYRGKRVVVVGSGATAVTLVPSLAESAAHVTMLQRSPTYVASRPASDAIADRLRTVAAAQARLRDRPVEERFTGNRDLQPEPAPSRNDEVDAAQGRGQATARGLRRRHPFRAVVQPVGPADVPGSRRRSVRRDPRRPRIGRHRPYRHLHRIRHPAAVRRRVGGRHRRQCHRPEPPRHRGDAARGRWSRGRPVKDGVLQGHDALGRAELRVDDWLHERVVDAEGRPGGRVRVPAAQAHGRARSRVGDARCGGRRCGQAVPGPGIGLRQAQPRRAAQAG